ncbi:hypothetical protein BD311DRAFT_753962 [Dichomitus squalens]|uniref:Uncharacterized protein n=1 Tax=Dichomitus squalens TaxID=114155 RepID=A0A4Q9MX56_9APHY|nr:hypothetical protein BD311DRAFT_753962 [Dichomitus squalens]
MLGHITLNALRRRGACECRLLFTQVCRPKTCCAPACQKPFCAERNDTQFQLGFRGM